MLPPDRENEARTDGDLADASASRDRGADAAGGMGSVCFRETTRVSPAAPAASAPHPPPPWTRPLEKSRSPHVKGVDEESDSCRRVPEAPPTPSRVLTPRTCLSVVLTSLWNPGVHGRAL